MVRCRLTCRSRRIGCSSSPMRRHARAVILLGGWLLLTPRIGTHRTGSIAAKYVDAGTYDSSAAGRAARKRRIADMLDSGLPRDVAVFTTGKCLPAEAVYPPQPSARK